MPMLLLMAACSAPSPVEPEQSASVEPEPSACVERTPTYVEPPSIEPQPSASMLPELGLPDARPNQRGGQHGWTGALHARAGMHRVIENRCSSGFRQTQLVFAVQNDCFPDSLVATGAEPQTVTVAGLDGLYLEGNTTDRTMLFSTPKGGETTGAYALPIGDRTLCVYLTWDPATTPDELTAVRQVVESIHGEANGPSGIRIIFRLPGGWDTG